MALRRFPFLARVCLRLICFALCVFLIRHQRAGKNAGQHNAELSVLILVAVFGPVDDTAEGREMEIKSGTSSCASLADGAAFITSVSSFPVLTRPVVDSSVASQFRRSALSETDSVNRFLGDEASQPMLRFAGPSHDFGLLATFWQNKKVQETV